MSDLARRVRALGEQVDAGYDAGRTEVALAGLRAKLHRRASRRIALGSALGVLCLAVGAFWAVRSRGDHGLSPPAPHAEALFALSDGSIVTPLDPNSRLLTKTVSPRLVELELVSGSAHFEVAPNREREFRVDAGRIEITVVGTKFSVERRGEHTAVAVQAGRVRVAWERGEQLLDPGEQGVFPPFQAATCAVPSPRPESTPGETATVQPRVSPARRAGDWRALAGHDAAAGAYRLLHDKSKTAGLNSIDDLLLAADVARRSGHAGDSVAHLQRALALNESDARLAVVAFTLGRVLLADLHDPAGAADAFARARAASPQGPLAEDALAREIEARYRCGDQARAHALAEAYLEMWPAGSRIRAVRHFGDLP